ncbi:acyl-CoA carboxylase subunit epsilon [Streptomyces sp. NPDC051207]|uniref:acyl-CoA carboxylase subunit epsilon n=1 Tax=Streptomyces sp. NPDC051207 TaxID=3154641 RepID=UPI003425364E
MTGTADTTDGTGTTKTTGPMLTVVRGRPDDLELAAVTVVLGALAQQADTTAPPSAPGPVGVRWGGDGRIRPAGSWRRVAGRHRPGPAGRARGMS